MEPVVRGAIIYFFLLIVMRLGGNRSLAQITMFDFILLLIISEAIQQAMLDNDSSMTNAFLLVITLVLLDIGLSLVKERFALVEKWMDGVPVILIDQGEIRQDRLKNSRVDEQDILEEARKLHGLENLSQIKYAILEKAGGISIIPKEK